MNIFEKYIQSGKIKNKEDLKRYYWILAKNVHPDMNHIKEMDEKFIKLKQNYDEALILLPIIDANKSTKKKLTKFDAQDAFQEIIARGFPVDIEVRNKSRLYIKGINEYSEIINEIDEKKNFVFEDVERELYLIRGSDIIQNALFGTIKMIFYSIVSYYYEPRKFIKNVVIKLYEEISEELKEREYFTVDKFLKWIIRDIG
jgi:hypothetical protein